MSECHSAILYRSRNCPAVGKELQCDYEAALNSWRGISAVASETLERTL